MRAFSRGSAWHRLRQEDFSQVGLEGSPELLGARQNMMRMDGNFVGRHHRRPSVLASKSLLERGWQWRGCLQMPKQSLCRVSASLPSASTGRSHTPPSHLNKSWSTKYQLPVFLFYLLRPRCGTIPFYHRRSNIFSPVGLSITIFYATELDCHIRITPQSIVFGTRERTRGFLLLSFACCGSFTRIYMAFCTTHIIMISIGFTCHFNSICHRHSIYGSYGLHSRNVTNVFNTNDKNLSVASSLTPSHTATENSAIYT